RDRARREPDRPGQAFLLDAEEFAERAVPAHRLLDGTGMFGIVQMEKVDALEAERFQALLERAARLGGVEAVGLGVAVELGRDDEALGQAAALANGGADPLFAAAEPVDARGVEEVGRPVENGVDRRPGALFVDAVA